MRCVPILRFSAQFLGLAGVLCAQQWSGLLDPSRAINWANAGIAAGVPSRSTICATISASTYGNGTTDATAAIRNALASCPSNQVVYLPAGTYLISSSIDVPSNVVLRGAGMGTTTIKGASGFSGFGLVGFNPNPQSLAGSVNISGSPAKGTTSLTTTSAHGLNVGDYIIIDQLDCPSCNPPVTNQGGEGTCTWCGRVSGRSLGQFTQVVAVPSSTTLTVADPLVWNFSASLSPQITKLNNPVVNAGLESLTIDNSLSQNQHVGLLWWAANCWFNQVEVYWSTREGMSLVGYRNLIRSSKIHETSLPLGPNSGYGLWIQTAASENLIDNNQFYNVSNPIIINGATSGNVIAYNYLRADDGNTGRQNGALSSHGANPVMNLIEGNQFVGVASLDFTWGSASYYTFYRNTFQLQSPLSTYPEYPFALDIRQDNWYMNFLGNVLWSSGLSGTYQCSSGVLDINSSVCLYTLGYTDGSPYTFTDSSVVSTLYRHGNFDYISNATQWDPNNSDHTLPPSFYLSAKPSFFGSCSWPSIGPDLSPMTTDIPAKRAYDGSPCATSVISLVPPTNLNATAY